MPIKDNRLAILSYSAYSVWKQCPRRYYREKVLREPREEDKTLTIPGTIVHLAAENFLKTGNPQFFDPQVIAAAVLKHSTDKGVDLEKHYDSIEKATEFVQKCADSMYWFLDSNNFFQNKNFLSEIWFGTWDEPLMLSRNLATQGAPDLIQKNQNGTCILYDYKATWTAKNLDVDQLILYSIAAKIKLGLDISMASFFTLPTRQHHYYSFTKQQKVDLLERLQVAADKILAGDFPTTPNAKCERCPYYNSCEDATKGKIKVIKPDPTAFAGLPNVSL